ncbi:MAG: DUF1735 domain-containing protein [Bacteroidetes bacterium]|nr:DUF1735 domain-containing protein [Bacteroidota bacterium]
MKRIILSSLFIAGVAVAFTGCLKDKGFENNEYGIYNPESQPPGVGFPYGSKSKTDYGLDVSASAQTVPGIVYVNLESATAAKADVNVTMVNNTTALLAAYNLANSTSILPLPTALYSVPLSLKILSGGRNVETEITISNTTGLDPNKSYAIGLTITAVDGGYKIAENLKNLLIVFSVKNRYDGKYNLRGYHNRTGFTNPYNETVEMETTGPNSVTMKWPKNTNQLYSHPLNGGITYYGSFTTNFYFDLSTNLMTAWDLTPWPTTVTPTVTPGTNSRYDPATKTIYANYYYNGNPGARQFWDTLKYIGPR